jgi:hypothetical protein
MRLHSPDQNTSLKLQTQECRRLVANRHFLGSPIAAAPSSSPHFLIIPIQFHGTSTVKNQDPTCQTSPCPKSAFSSIPEHIHVTADLSPEVGTWRGGKSPLTSPLRIHTIGPSQSFKHFPSNTAKLFHQRLFSTSLHSSTSYHVCSLACKFPLHTSRFEQLLSSNIKEQTMTWICVSGSALYA